MIQKEYNLDNFETISFEDIDYLHDEYGSRTVTKYFSDKTSPKEHYYKLFKKDLPLYKILYHGLNYLSLKRSDNQMGCSIFISRNPDMSLESYYLQVMHLENYKKLPRRIRKHFNNLKDDKLDGYTGFYIKYNLEFKPVRFYYWVERPYIEDFLLSLSKVLNKDIQGELSYLEDMSKVEYIIFGQKEDHGSLYVSNKREWS